MSMIKPINPEHKKILDKIRELYIASGGKPFYDPEDFGLYEHDKSNGGVQIHFDYGSPDRMYTPDGGYVILGSHIMGNQDKFLELFTAEFEVVTIVEKRNDGKITWGDYLSQYSGPVVRIISR